MILALWLTAAARTMRDFIATEPGNVFMTLPASTRLDMIDYYDAGGTATLPTLTDGSATLQVLTDDYMKMSTSGARTVELKLLTTRRDTVLLAIETVSLPVQDSRVSCYDRNWSPVPLKRVMGIPSWRDLFAPNADDATRDSVMRVVKFPLLTWHCRGDKYDSIVVEPTLADFYSAEPATERLLRRALRHEIVYTIKGTKLRRTDK